MRRIRNFLEDHLPFRLQWIAKFIVVNPLSWLRILKALNYKSMASFDPSTASVNNTIVNALILQLYGPGLLKTVLEAAEKLNITLFLTYGTLLGHYRDGGFIKHDWDIDLGMLEGDIPKMPLLIDAVRKKGYLLARESKHRMAFSDRDNLVHLDIDYYFNKEGKMVHYVYNVKKKELYTFSYPPDIFRSFTEVKFLNDIRSFAPVDAERFLTETYGDWRTPKTGLQPSDFPNVTITKIELPDIKNYVPFQPVEQRSNVE